MGADGSGPRGSDDLRGRGSLKPVKVRTPSGDKKLSASDKLDALDAVVAAIAHPARRQILLTLHFRGGVATAGELAARFEHAWPTTTRHLRVLEDAGLLTYDRIGRTRRYRIDRERLSLVAEWLAWFDR